VAGKEEALGRGKGKDGEWLLTAEELAEEGRAKYYYLGCAPVVYRFFVNVRRPRAAFRASGAPAF
jgi:hypothetical protein